MGRAVADLAPERGHAVVTRFDADRPLTGADGPDALHGADAVVDFSLPDVAVVHMQRYARWGVPAVVGTTGWYDELDAVRALVSDHDARLLYAPNFSIGVALLVRALRAVLPQLDALPAYDAFVHEQHHVGKVDSPSGTARMLGETVRDGLARKTRLETETQHGRIDPEALHVTSARVGAVVGDHVVGFDSAFDQLRFTHHAKTRQGFAFGALRAAEWLVDQPAGLYTLEDVLR